MKIKKRISRKELKALIVLADEREKRLLQESGVFEVKHLKIEQDLRIRVKSLEIALNNSKADSSELSKKLESAMDYVHDVSHDLRKSLANIIQFSDLLLEGYKNFSSEETQEFLTIIANSGNKLLKKIRSYLLLLKIEQGEEESLLKTPKLVKDLTDEIEQIFSNFRREKNLQVFFNDPDTKIPFLGLAQKKIFIEEGLFDSLLVNLIQNAIEASPRRKDKISVNIYEKNGNFCLSFSNQGEVPKEIREKLFQKFVSSKKHGNGLGLYSARIIARAHGGELSYRPLSGGSRFTVSIPFK